MHCVISRKLLHCLHDARASDTFLMYQPAAGVRRTRLCDSVQLSVGSTSGRRLVRLESGVWTVLQAANNWSQLSIWGGRRAKHCSWIPDQPRAAICVVVIVWRVRAVLSAHTIIFPLFFFLSCPWPRIFCEQTINPSCFSSF